MRRPAPEEVGRNSRDHRVTYEGRPLRDSAGLSTNFLRETRALFFSAKRGSSARTE